LFLDGPGFLPDVFDIVYCEAFQDGAKKAEQPDQESSVNDFEK
jgi:hypothetical protein